MGPPSPPILITPGSARPGSGAGTGGGGSAGGSGGGVSQPNQPSTGGGSVGGGGGASAPGSNGGSATGIPAMPAGARTFQFAGATGDECDDNGVSGFDERVPSVCTFQNDPGAEDGRVCRCDYRKRVKVSGGAGRILWPGAPPAKGDTVTFQMRAKLDPAWTSSDRDLKWMRIGFHTAGSRYKTWYFNRPTLVDQAPFNWLGGGKHVFGRADSDDPRYGSFDVYTYRCVLDDVAVDDGGSGQCEFWLNSRRLQTFTFRAPLEATGDAVSMVEVIGSWDPSVGPGANQSLWIDWVKLGVE